ncbi:MAG: HAD family hydrolase [Gammaproteobacteria bacterium]|nr:HAD family hydrolase [Gammaproteobacteria bacterium]
METILKKAKSIRLVIFDVDGVLTDGKITYDDKGHEYKSFHVHDGQGMVLLQKTGVNIGIITARKSEIVTRRMKELGISQVYQGHSDKLVAYEELKLNLNLQDSEIAYVGDDIHDLPMLRRVGLSIAVANALPLIQQHAVWVTKNKGGKGAAREVCELIMNAQNTYESAIQYFVDR